MKRAWFLRNKNNMAKILAFFMAITLWLYVSEISPTAQEAALTISNVPLTYRNLDENMALMEFPETIDVTLKGSAGIVSGIAPQDLEVYADLSELGEGQHSIVPQAVLPRGAQVVSFRPQLISVTMEEIVSTAMKVQIELAGDPIEGIVMGEIQIMPEQVFVRGPVTVLEGVAAVIGSVNIDGSGDDVVQMVQVTAVDQNGNPVDFVTVSPEEVEVIIPFGQPVKEVSVRVMTTGEPAAGYRLRQINIIPNKVII